MESNVVAIKPEIAEFPLKAIKDIVIVEQLTEDFSSGGIALVGDDRKMPSGRIVACGPGKTYDYYMDASGNTMAGRTVPMELKVGDWVLFGKYLSGGEPIEIDGKRYLMCRENDIAATSRSGEPMRVRLSPNPNGPN